jgi:hypothetical protein
MVHSLDGLTPELMTSVILEFSDGLDDEAIRRLEELIEETPVCRAFVDTHISSLRDYSLPIERRVREILRVGIFWGWHARRIAAADVAKKGE